MNQTNLTPELQNAWLEIEQYAKDYGLDFFPIIYEVLDYKTLYEVAALGGFPIRYPHWRFGMQYNQMSKGYTYGLSVIYEMVINTNPSSAYLLEGNEMVTQKMVMAHVTAHVDFFKHNMWFAHTNRKMLDEMANHASRIERLINRYGYDTVEAFIDVCLSLENLIDYHAPYIKRPAAITEEPVVEEEDALETEPVGFKVERSYMRDYINPPECLAAERDEQRREQEKTKQFPENPQRDILLFLLDYAPLQRWQHTVLEIIRDEAYYYVPQGMTKVMNEGWACLVAGSLIYTENGLLPLDELVRKKLPVILSDGESCRHVYDWTTFDEQDTIWICTRRGFELEGSMTHRVMLFNQQWKRLDELKIGERILLGAGLDIWPQKCVPISWQPDRRITLEGVASQANVNLSTVIRYRKGMRGPHSQTLEPLVANYEEQLTTSGQTHSGRVAIRIPAVVDESLAAYLGYLIGDGHISAVKRVIGLTTGDEEQAEQFIALTQELFGLEARLKWDKGRWRISVYSLDLIDFLTELGLKTGKAARFKEIPASILRSPKKVAASFLRAYYDSDGYAGSQGVILSTFSRKLSETVPLLLLNFGILSRRRRQKDGGWHIHTTGKSAKLFQEQIGFGLKRKQNSLSKHIEERQWFKRENWGDEIVAIERRRAKVYDISVAETHRYAAQGFVNHNSYWHSRIMTEKALTDAEVITFADQHAGVVSVSSGRLNPYKLGLELLRDIEDRWNKGKFGKEYEECDDIQAKRNWDQKLGLGRLKIFEVRKLYNDVTFIDEFLTPEFVAEQKLFAFDHNPHTNYYEIISREFPAVKEKLLFSLTNFGQPFIEAANGNYKNRGELYLRHRHEGIDLRIDYACDTLRNIHTIWTRPVHIETTVDSKLTLLTFDGTEFSQTEIE